MANARNRIDTIHMQVMWNRLISVVEEQAQTLVRTAFGPPTREAGDLSAGVFLPTGEMIAQAVTGTPGHVNSMAEAVRHFLLVFPGPTMKPGDVYITNDPWKGTGHLNDFTVVTPTFHRKKLVALFACTVHVTDIGGLGFGPDANQVYAEGLFIPILKLADRGQLDPAIMGMIRENVREPIEVEGDVHALVACNEIGSRRLVSMMTEYKLANLEMLGRYIVKRSRDAMLEAVREWPQGTWHSEVHMDGYERPITLKAALTISKSGVHVDFSGTSPVSTYGINVPKAYTDAYSSFGVRCIIGATLPNNAGSLGVVTVSAPEDCILNAPRPLAVAARSIVGQALPDAVFGCLHQAWPERVPAESSSCLWNVRLAGGQAIKTMEASALLNATRFNVVSFNTGGTGARPGKDGLNVTSFPSGIRNVSVEVIEHISPVVYWRKEFRPDSGGAGEFRGGLGQIMEISNQEPVPMIIGATFDRIANPARGFGGGKSALGGRLHLKSGVELAGKGRQIVPAGDRVIVETPGGGGYGDPARRDPAAIARDIRNGLVTNGGDKGTA